MTTRFLSLVLFCVYNSLSLTAQDLEAGGMEESALDQIPAEPLVDFGEVFRNHPEQREKLNQRLERIAREDDFTVYFVAYSGIIGSDVAEKAKNFRDLWLGSETEGLVFVCDTDMKTMAYSLTRAEGLSLEGEGQVWKLPEHEILAAMIALTKISGEGLSESEYLNTVGNRLVDELAERTASRQQVTKRSNSGFLLTFGLTAGLVFLLAWWAQKQRAGRLVGPSVAFPPLKVQPRLGAQFGGGMVAEITFQPPSFRDHS